MAAMIVFLSQTVCGVLGAHACVAVSKPRRPMKRARSLRDPCADPEILNKVQPANLNTPGYVEFYSFSREFRAARACVRTRCSARSSALAWRSRSPPWWRRRCDRRTQSRVPIFNCTTHTHARSISRWRVCADRRVCVPPTARNLRFLLIYDCAEWRYTCASLFVIAHTYTHIDRFYLHVATCTRV